MTSALLFFALTLATYRVWRFVGLDSITEFARDRLLGDAESVLRRYLHDLVICPWCAGTWIAVGGTYATHRYVTSLEPHWLLWAVAVAGVVGFLGDIDAKLSE